MKIKLTAVAVVDASTLTDMGMTPDQVVTELNANQGEKAFDRLMECGGDDHSKTGFEARAEALPDGWDKVGG
jgi:hypothetical protein